jgi:hypothetical protein
MLTYIVCTAFTQLVKLLQFGNPIKIFMNKEVYSRIENDFSMSLTLHIQQQSHFALQIPLHFVSQTALLCVTKYFLALHKYQTVLHRKICHTLKCLTLHAINMIYGNIIIIYCVGEMQSC